jgi:hypothetical protein
MTGLLEPQGAITKPCALVPPSTLSTRRGKNLVIGGTLRKPGPEIHLPQQLPSPASEASPPSGIDRALSEAVKLIENALVKHRSIGEERSVVELSDSEEGVAITVARLLSEARRELVCVSTPESMTTGPFQATADFLRTPTDQRYGPGPGPGPGMRILLPVRDRDACHPIRSLVPAEGPHELRVTESPLQEMLLVDRRIALVISQFGPSVRQTLIVRSPAILKAVHGLFTDSWGSASPLRPVALLDDPRQRETTRQILASLRNGQKDDVAARELGMSVRTYRRYVADFMREINATSRFQAGVRAAELRLLPS